MKKSLLLLLGAVLVTGAFFIYTKPLAPQTIVVFGDSLTYGVGSEKGGGFVTILEEELGMPVENLGLTGDTTEGALRRISQVTNRKPAVTIILLGGNDFLRGISQEKTFENLGKIIEAIEAGGSKVILVGLEPVIAQNGERQAFDALAKKYKTAYVPNILQGIYGRLDMMSDNLHPNDKGYALMAERIEPALRQLLK